MLINQYASTVINYSSQNSATDFSASTALGAPDITSYLTDGTLYTQGWLASSQDGTTETLTLGFATPVYLTNLWIYETQGNGFVTNIELLSTDGIYNQWWSGFDNAATNIVAASNWYDTNGQSSYLVQGIRITVDTSHSTEWEQIDAVEIQGYTADSSDDYPANTSSAGYVNIGNSTTGNIETVGDSDWFYVYLTAGHSYQFDLKAVGTGDGTLKDPYLKLLNSVGTLIKANDDASGASTLNSLISYTAPNSGYYHLAAASTPSPLPGTIETGTYKLVATEITNHVPTGAVAINDMTPAQKQTLTVSNTLADLDGLGTIAYQWKANGTAISGATSNSFTPTQAQVGKTLTVTASYTDGFGTVESKTSAATSAVSNVNDLPTGTVSITGTAKQGQTLTAHNTLADVDGLGTIAYQWKANGTAISGATGTTFTPTQAQSGKTLTVTASYTDGFGTAESKTSAATTAVISTAPGVTFKLLTTNANTSEGNFLIDGTRGDAVKYSVVLKTPLAESDSKVVIDFVSSDTTEGTVTPRLTFTASNWNTPQTITIQGQDDMQGGPVNAVTGLQAAEGATAYTISATINQNLTTDLHYTTVFLPTYTLQNNDDIQDIPINGGDPHYPNVGTSAVDYMYGSNLNDQMYAGYGFDQIKGGYGDDNLYGEQGNDWLYGQQGNDVLYGGYQNDKLYGNDGNDKLYGEQDVDQLDGGNGNDWLDGGLGADNMIGGVGNDTYVVDDIKDVITDKGSSTDVDIAWIQITAGAYTLGASLENAVIKTDADVGINGNAQNNILTGGSGYNKLNGGWGNDKLNGNAGNDTLVGDLGNDTLNGGIGNDSLIGGTGNDTALGGDNNDRIVAGDGTDTVNGGTGNDFVDGGNGNDTLTLGAGSDMLYCGNYSGVDKVTDFNPTYDTVQLENTVFAALGISIQAGEFVKAATAKDSNDYLVYNNTTGSLYYDSDGSGASSAQLLMTIGININLTIADFIIV